MAKQPLPSSGFLKLTGNQRDPICPSGKMFKVASWNQVRGLSGPRAQVLPYPSCLLYLLPLVLPRPYPRG